MTRLEALSSIKNCGIEFDDIFLLTTDLHGILGPNNMN